MASGFRPMPRLVTRQILENFRKKDNAQKTAYFHTNPSLLIIRKTEQCIVRHQPKHSFYLPFQ